MRNDSYCSGRGVREPAKLRPGGTTAVARREARRRRGQGGGAQQRLERGSEGKRRAHHLSVRSICIVRLTPASAEMISDGTRPEVARDSDAPHRASSARGEPATVALKALEVRACGIHE